MFVNNFLKRFFCVGSFLFLSAISTPLYSDDGCDCADYVHLFDAKIGKLEDLPEGFFLFENNNAMYKSSNKVYSPSLVPNTEGSKPEFIKISDDGKWILYRSAIEGAIYLIKIDGSAKTKVPVGDGIPAFYRNSPYGSEIAYTEGRWYAQKVYAISAKFSDNGVTFGSKRLIVDTEGKIDIWGFAISVSGNRFYTSMHKHGNITLSDSILTEGSGFFTIPNNGKGTATFKNLYRFKPDPQEGGCNSAMSHDGKLCVGNVSPRKCAYHGSDYGYLRCVPEDHEGFYMVPFKLDTDAPVGKAELSDRLGISMNHCPDKFWPLNYTIMGYEGWNFSNDNQYLTGFVTGSDTTFHGAWVVHWKTNTWTPLTPELSKTEVTSAAIYMNNVTGVQKSNMRNKVYSSPVKSLNIDFVGKNAPFKIVFKIDGNIEPFAVKLYSMNGEQIITNFKHNQSTDTYELSAVNNISLANGVYFIKVPLRNGNFKAFRFFVQ